MITHAEDFALDVGGWITRCGCFADTRDRLSDDPTCDRCRCWLGLCECVEVCQGPYGGARNDGADDA